MQRSALSRAGAFLAVSAALVLSSRATADDEASDPSRALAPDRLVGRRAADFTLLDVLAKRDVRLYGFAGKAGAVLVFLGTECPVGDLYLPRLVELNREFGPKGIVFLGINANSGESDEEIAAHAREFGVDFPILKDRGNTVADAILAERTPEVVVLDGTAKIRYRGAIDDQYGVGSRKPAPEREHLRKALEAVVAGRSVEVSATTVAGCLIQKEEVGEVRKAGVSRVRAPSAEVLAARSSIDQPVADVGTVTFASKAAAIVQEKCQSCHRPGQVAPFSMLTYDEVRKHSAMIREVVDERRMPPWHADPRYGSFSNDRSLTAEERATLLAWIDQGSPLGDPKDLPAPRKFPEGWTIGEPDIVFEIPEPNVVPAQGTVDYVRVKVPTNFQEDVWVQAAEAQPTDRSVVHHIIVYVEDPEKKGRAGLGGAHLCGYAPGDMPSVYPDGTAKKIPAGSTLLFEIHYTPIGRVLEDRSRLGLILAKKPVERQAFTLPIVNTRFVLRANQPDEPVSATMTVPKEMRLLSFMPHMHLRGKDFRYRITRPGGEPEVALSVPAYDFGWQSYYTLKEPAILPKGTKIDCLAHYDNSAGNPNNPDPNRDVRWGDQTSEEMMIGYIDVDFPLGETIDRRAMLRAGRPVLRAVEALRTAARRTDALDRQASSR